MNHINDRMRRSISFFPNRNGTAETVARNAAHNLTFTGIAPAYAGETPLLEAKIGYVAEEVPLTDLDPVGLHSDTAHIAPMMQDLIRGKWRTQHGQEIRIVGQDGQPLVPGYFTRLTALADPDWKRSADEAKKTVRFCNLRIPAEILDGRDDRRGAPRLHRSFEHFCFAQLIREWREDQKEMVTVGSFIGSFSRGGFRTDHSGGTPVQRAGVIEIFELDRVLTRQVMLAADCFYAETATNELDAFQYGFCRDMDVLDKELEALSMTTESLERMSLAHYGNRRWTLEYSTLSEERKAQRAYFAQVMKETDPSKRPFGLMLEDALFKGNEAPGLSKPFKALDVFETTLLRALEGTKVPEKQMTAFLTKASAAAREALEAVVTKAMGLNAAQRLLMQQYGEPVTERPDNRSTRSNAPSAPRDHAVTNEVPSDEAPDSQEEEDRSGDLQDEPEAQAPEAPKPVVPEAEKSAPSKQVEPAVPASKAAKKPASEKKASSKPKTRGKGMGALASLKAETGATDKTAN